MPIAASPGGASSAPPARMAVRAAASATGRAIDPAEARRSSTRSTAGGAGWRAQGEQEGRVRAYGGRLTRPRVGSDPLDEQRLQADPELAPGSPLQQPVLFIGAGALFWIGM